MDAFEKLCRLFKKLGPFCPNHPRYCGSRGNGRCQVCKDKKVIDIFDGYTTKKSYKINHKFSFYEKCLIYFFICRTCGKEYMGETTDGFRFRKNNNKIEARKPESDYMEIVKQIYLQSHFLQDDQRLSGRCSG